MTERFFCVFFYDNRYLVALHLTASATHFRNVVAKKIHA